MSLSILFLGKAGDSLVLQALDYAKKHCENVCATLLRRGDKLPVSCYEWSGTHVISYLSPLIIPRTILQRASVAAINFHPGPPEFPGIGCTNFAIYQGKREFGVTCHHMEAKVDTGPIIAVERFPLYSSDSVLSLTKRCYIYISMLFYRIFDTILLGQPLPSLAETWQRSPLLRQELNDLCKLTFDMSEPEMSRRIRAVTFPGAPGAYIEFGGRKYEIKELSKLGEITTGPDMSPVNVTNQREI